MAPLRHAALLRALLSVTLLQAVPCLGAKQAKAETPKTVPLYGNLETDGHYFLSLSVGTPPQRVLAALDWEKGGIAFPCQPCGAACGEGVPDRSFVFKSSSSASWETCGEDKCSVYTARSTEALDSVKGFLFRDKVIMDGAAPSNEAVSMRLVCDGRSYDPTLAGCANGVLGLGPTDRGVLSNVFQEMIPQDKAVSSAEVFFSVCLGSSGGQLTINGYDERYHTTPMTWVPLRTTESGYEVRLSSIKVGDTEVTGSFNGVLMGAGEVYSLFPTNVYRQLSNAIELFCTVHTCQAFRRGSCWHLSNTQGPSQFPTLKLSFKNSSSVLDWQPDSYLRRQGKTTTWCYAFDDNGETGESILGTAWMLNKEVVFDAWQERLWVAPAKCPQHEWPAGKAEGEVGEEVPASPTRPPAEAGAGGAAPGPARSTPAPQDPSAPKPPQRDDSLIEPLPQTPKVPGDQSPGNHQTPIKGRRQRAIVWLCGFFGAVVAGFVVCSPGARAFLEGGQRRAQLRETLIDDMLGGVRQRGAGTNSPEVEATQTTPVELMSHRDAHQVADEQE